MINDKLTPAVGEVTYQSGQLLDVRGNPIRGAVIEVWQCDSNGTYLKQANGGARGRGGRGGRGGGKWDGNFQRFGRFVTGVKGEYAFRVIKPVPYAGRPAPHIHCKIKRRGRPD